MTECVSGDHDFPIEDEAGAYCEEHGVTLLFHGPPATPEDHAHDYLSRRQALGPAAPPAIPLQRDH
ncbi:hypothetical protein [Streptomyces sp. NPDC051569]|uniref:hypothetical protein n=1 Tax=Streptomyces sp. NPDC051569 TaxID=3365661 RepID=UPI00379EB3CF